MCEWVDEQMGGWLDVWLMDGWVFHWLVDGWIDAPAGMQHFITKISIIYTFPTSLPCCRAGSRAAFSSFSQGHKCLLGLPCARVAELPRWMAAEQKFRGK